jgi:type III pantothenate kinase
VCAENFSFYFQNIVEFLSLFAEMEASVVCIDRGNSLIKLGVYRHYAESRQASYHTFTDEDELVRFLSSLESSYALVSANSGPELKRVFSLPGISELLRIDSESDFPFEVQHPEPSKIGTDRLCAVAGAVFTKGAYSCLIVDAGTCMTFEYLEAGIYKGGAISPGLSMRLKAMSEGTTALPDVKPGDDFSFPAQSTLHNLLAGAILGAAMEIDGHVRRFKETNHEGLVIITGGDAIHLVNRLESPIFVAPNLVLDGMYHLFKCRNV